MKVKGLNRMNNVLIADSDSVVCSMLTRALSDISDDLQPVTAKNGQAAVDALKTDHIDLVITEIALPDMDGIQLLTHIRTNYPRIPVFLMTAFGTSEIKKQIDAIGYTAYFDKPLNIEHLKKSIQKAIDLDIEGKINGISLTSYLQVLAGERKTCTLLVSAGRKRGNLFFQKGELVYAETGALKNEDAAYEMISWNGTVIRIKAGCDKKEGEIKQPLKAILMAGLKKQKTKSNDSLKIATSRAAASMSSKQSSSMHKMPHQKPPKRNSSELERLLDLLRHNNDILEYAVFSDKGSLMAKHLKSDDVLKCNASSYLKFSQKLNPLVNGGKLRYIMLTKEDNSRYIMFAHEKTRITAAVKPGFKTKEFLKKIAA